MTKQKSGIDQKEYGHITDIGQYSDADQLRHDDAMLKKPYDGKSKQELLQDYLQNDPNLNMQVVSDGGVIKVIPLKLKAKQDVCIIDWVNFHG